MENSKKSLQSDPKYGFLSKIVDLLFEEKAFTTHDDGRHSIVNFKQPADLEKIFESSLNEEHCLIGDDDKLLDICRSVIKWSVKTNNQNFHNQLFGGVDHVGVGAEWILSSLNTSQYTFEMAPVFTLVEREVIRQCLNLFGFLNGDGIFCAGGSMSNMYGMHMARFSRFPDTKINGNPTGLVMFTSNLSHYSICKGANFLGIGTKNVIKIDMDESGQMIIDDLEQKIKKAIQDDKLIPFMVNATCGSTVLGSFDDLTGIATICKKYQLWMHVDACLGGSAIFSKNRSKLMEGINLANSMSWNPHKSLGVPLQCSIFLVNQNPTILYDCNSSSADYLFQLDKMYDRNYDSGDKSLSCGRKVDAFKFWLMWKKHGTAGFRTLMDNAFQMSQYLLIQIQKRPNFHLIINDPKYTNICFYYFPENEHENLKCWHCISKLTLAIKQEMTRNGNLMITYSPWMQMDIGYFFRMVVTAQPKATKDSMDFVVNEIEKIGESLPASSYLCHTHSCVEN